jgi:hypothetical protein
MFETDFLVPIFSMFSILLQSWARLLVVFNVFDDHPAENPRLCPGFARVSSCEEPNSTAAAVSGVETNGAGDLETFLMGLMTAASLGSWGSSW